MNDFPKFDHIRIMDKYIRCIICMLQNYNSHVVHLMRGEITPVYLCVWFRSSFISKSNEWIKLWYSSTACTGVYITNVKLCMSII